MFDHPAAWLGVGLLAIVGVAVGAAAHNPADTIYHPAPVGEDLLVVGGEGTWAQLTPEGEVTDRGNLSSQGEVIGPPTAAGGSAAVLVRTYPDTELVLQGFDEQGPSWQVQVEPGEAEAIGYLASDGDRFAVVTDQARMVEVSPSGEVEAERELAAKPTATPAPDPSGGWWLAYPSELVHRQGGESTTLASYDAFPTDVTVEGERVYLSLAHRSERQGELRVYEGDELAFSRTIDGMRFGGSPAAAGERIVVGTYDPDGAQLVALDAHDGSRAWDRQIAGATAVAPASVNGTIVAASNDHILAYEPDGTQRWQQQAQPYLDSPVAVGDHVVPSSAGNQLVAYEPDGTKAWTFTDGVDMPSWSHHGDAPTSEPNASTDEDSSAPQASTPGPALGVTALAAALAALGGARRWT